MLCSFSITFSLQIGLENSFKDEGDQNTGMHVLRYRQVATSNSHIKKGDNVSRDCFVVDSLVIRWAVHNVFGRWGQINLNDEVRSEVLMCVVDKVK